MHVLHMQNGKSCSNADEPWPSNKRFSQSSIFACVKYIRKSDNKPFGWNEYYYLRIGQAAVLVNLRCKAILTVLYSTEKEKNITNIVRIDELRLLFQFFWLQITTTEHVLEWIYNLSVAIFRNFQMFCHHTVWHNKMIVAMSLISLSILVWKLLSWRKKVWSPLWFHLQCYIKIQQIRTERDKANQ